MITKEQHSRWLEALRSGAYSQGKWRLRSIDNKFCCLGVLADVMDPNAWLKNCEEFYWKGHRFRVPEFTLSLMVQSDLEQANDNEGKSFLEIADWIEENITPEQDMYV